MDFQQYKKKCIETFHYVCKLYQEVQDDTKNLYRIIAYKRAILYVNSLSSEKEFAFFYDKLKRNKITGLSPKFATKFKQIDKMHENAKLFCDKLKQKYKENDDFMYKIADVLKQKINTRIEILGSICRKDYNVKDIDILVENSQKETLLKEFQKKIKITKISNINDEDFSITRLQAEISHNSDKKKVNIEIYTYEKKSYAPMKLYLTGSKYMQICLRQIFQKLGLTLNQKYIKGKEIFYPQTEEEIFVMAGFKYLQPEFR